MNSENDWNTLRVDADIFESEKKIGSKNFWIRVDDALDCYDLTLIRINV